MQRAERLTYLVSVVFAAIATRAGVASGMFPLGLSTVESMLLYVLYALCIWLGSVVALFFAQELCECAMRLTRGLLRKESGSGR